MADGQPRAHDLAGHSFGRLTVTTQSEKRGRNRMYWLCLCACGNSKWVIADALKSGATQSCGCLNEEVRRSIHKPGVTKDGKHSPEYRTWHGMKQRCTNPNNTRYARYGGRGIKLCERWLSFENFLADMGARPTPQHTIERKDNDGDYEPSNCIWATKAQQNRNNSRTRMVTFRGETMCIGDWVQRTGIPHATLHHRLKHWPVDRALTTPVQA